MVDRFVLGVCGGRDFADVALVLRTLDRVHAKPDTVVMPVPAQACNDERRKRQEC